MPDVDIFASRLNNQFPKYVSYRAEPEAIAVEAFSISWSKPKISLFSSFQLHQQMLTKNEDGKILRNNSFSRFRKSIATNGHSKDTTEIIVASWKNNTKKSTRFI